MPEIAGADLSLGSLGRKVGPLPLWGWAVVGAVGFAAILWWRGRSGATRGTSKSTPGSGSDESAGIMSMLSAALANLASARPGTAPGGEGLTSAPPPAPSSPAPPPAGPLVPGYTGPSAPPGGGFPVISQSPQGGAVRVNLGAPAAAPITAGSGPGTAVTAPGTLLAIAPSSASAPTPGYPAVIQPGAAHVASINVVPGTASTGPAPGPSGPAPAPAGTPAEPASLGPPRYQPRSTPKPAAQVALATPAPAPTSGVRPATPS